MSLLMGTGTACLCATTGAQAGVNVQVFQTADRQAWFDAVEAMVPVTTIPFTGFDEGTVITNQFAHLNVLFEPTNDRIAGPDVVTHPNDGWGLDGNESEIILNFATPQYAVAADYVSLLGASIYWQGTLIYDNDLFGSGAGPGEFAGLTSDHPFDRVIFSRLGVAEPRLDDLHFAVPAPGALALFCFAASFITRRRRI